MSEAQQPQDEGYAVVDPDRVKDYYAEDEGVRGEFRRLTEALGCRQLAATLIRVPPHSDFEQGTGHFHEEIEELYLLSRGTLTMRFGEDIRKVSAPAAVRVAGPVPRSHRNEGEEARGAVGHLAQTRSPGRHEDRGLLGGLTRRSAVRRTTDERPVRDALAG
jgi:mannose-6-phosphate isomerase-like protein (cupin superfamily)